MEVIAQTIVNGLVSGATLALIATGLTLVFGVLRVVNFAHGAMFMVGAYLSYWIVGVLGLPYWLGVMVGGAGIAALAMVSYFVVFKRFVGLLLEGCIAAVMLTLLLENGMQAAVGAAPRSVHSGLEAMTFNFWGVSISAQRILIVAVSVAGVVWLAWFVKKTSTGRAMRAVQQDPEIALAQGISVDRISAVTFAVGGALAGVAGAVVAPDQSLLPTMGSHPLLLAFVVIILGGMGNIYGALVAAVVVGLTQAVVETTWVPQAALWVSFTVVIILMLIRPKGVRGDA